VLGFRRPAADPREPVEELKLAWTLTVAACALGAWLTTWLIPWPEWLSQRPWWAGGRTPESVAAGALLLIPGILLALSSVRALGRPTGLVTTGPYRWIRHPYSLAILLLLAGAIIALRSLPAVVLLIPAARLTVERARREEHNLRIRFGARHEAYSRRVPFILPLSPPLPPEGLPEDGALLPGEASLASLNREERDDGAGRP
jgi:protein-S-isoprenylcysteine O-methyltransferase Ste14